MGCNATTTDAITDTTTTNTTTDAITDAAMMLPTPLSVMRRTLLKLLCYTML